MCDAGAFDGAITIGRGVGARALADRAWSRFRQITARLAGSYTRAIYVQNQGRGPWDGGTEENFVVTFGGLADRDRDALQLHLRRLAHRFNQDAIALLLGKSELVTPFSLPDERRGAYAG
jgi:hypothetical protein